MKGAVPKSILPALFNTSSPAEPVPVIIASTSTPDRLTDVAETLFVIVNVPTDVSVWKSCAPE